MTCMDKSAVSSFVTTIPILLQGHTGAVIALATFQVGDVLLLISSAEDQQVLVWECQLAPQHKGSSPYSSWGLRQKVEAGKGLQHCLAVTTLPHQPDWYVA